MSKYKVGDTFFVAPSGKYREKEGWAKVTKVWSKYAEIAFLGKGEYINYRLIMEKGIVCDANSCEVGVAYQSKDAYDVETGVKKAALKISKAMSDCEFHSKLLSKSIGDLRRIAEMLDINLSE